jgi:hypothetical protein
MRRAEYLWDIRPGMNVDKVKAHGLTTEMWERVYESALEAIEDKDDPTVYVAVARVAGTIFRVVYSIEEGDVVTPISVAPITGFSTSRRFRKKKT